MGEISPKTRMDSGLAGYLLGVKGLADIQRFYFQISKP